jgi:hypothetical protein
MVLLKGKIAKSIPLKGSFGNPVILTFSIGHIDPISCEFATPFEEIASLFPEEASFNTSNGTYISELDFSSNFDMYHTGEQHVVALFDLVPMFKNRPSITVTVTTPAFLASSSRVLASNNHFNIQ